MEQPSSRMQARPASARPLAVAIVAVVFSMTGCQGMATTVQDSSSPASRKAGNTVADWPLKFVQHNFGAISYSTYGCTVLYNGFRHLSEPEDKLQMSSQEAHPDSLKNTTAGYLGVFNFPSPAQVRWRSKDGVSHDVEVDIGAIFKDQLILHNVPREEVSGSHGVADIILEVNDRTINVYMRAFISTKSLQELGNPHSGFRDDLVLAWSKTY